MSAHNDYGEWGELVAQDYLRRQGYVILERNWRSLSGVELDIVARLNDLLVIVEVKTRSNELYGSAAEAVDDRQIRHICRATGSYVKYHRLSLPIRYDIITVVGHDPNPKVTHIEGAFLPPINYVR